MELRVLQYFLAVAREQSILRAAEYLHLSQPTLSRQLKDLETSLGHQLFVRGNRKITLTEEGRILRKRAEEILDLVQKTEREVMHADETVTGEIHIGAGETDAMRCIAAAVHRLQAHRPQIRVHISSGDSLDVTERLDKGLLDFGVLFDPMDLSQYNHLRIPQKDVWGVLMRRDAPLAQKAHIEAEDLWDKPLILSRQQKEGSDLSRWLKKSFSELTVTATYSLLYNGSVLVEEGVGYALCLDGIVHADGESRLCFRPLYPRLEVGLNIVWKKYQVFSKAAEKFLDVLQKGI